MLLHHLAGTGLVLHDVDPSPDMVALARGAGLAARMTFTGGAAGDPPFEDGSVDLVVSSLSLHHWPDQRAAAREARRVLRPGGRLLAHDFRFARMDLAAVGAQSGEVGRTPVRLVLARLAARWGGRRPRR